MTRQPRSQRRERQNHVLRWHQSKDLCELRSQRQMQGDFVAALAEGIGHDAVNPDGRG